MIRSRNVNRMGRAVRSGLLVVTALLSAGTAAAQPNFPELLAKALAMPCTPQCTVCHRDNNGGFGTLRKTVQGSSGFGVNLTQFGLAVGDPGSVASSAQAADEAGQDSDGDGTPDVTELRAGDDPNDATAGATVCGAQGPEYGCARVAPAAPLDTTALGVSLVTLAGLTLLRRRR